MVGTGPALPLSDVIRTAEAREFDLDVRINLLFLILVFFIVFIDVHNCNKDKYNLHRSCESLKFDFTSSLFFFIQVGRLFTNALILSVAYCIKAVYLSDNQDLKKTFLVIYTEPSQVRNLNVAVNPDNTLTITFNEPVSPNGQLLFYTIFIM